jgi:hypothetical protein
MSGSWCGGYRAEQVNLPGYGARRVALRRPG